jgi:pimeloyl-ACP methyl ester carboxylesterase
VAERAGGEERTPGAHLWRSEAPPALLLHGQPGSARDWDGIVAAIGGRIATIAVDRPGWDEHSAPGGLAASADAALAELDRRGIEQAVVAGLSFGGAVAAWLATRHPDRVAGLVLVSAAANRESLTAFDRLLAVPVAGYLAGSLILSIAGLGLSARAVRGRLESTYEVSDGYLLAAGRRLCGRAAHRAFFVEQRALIRDLPVLECSLAQICAPTTVLVGTRDRIVPPAAGRRLVDQIPGARLVEIASGRHVLIAQHPRRVAEAIIEAAARAGQNAAALDAASG